MNDVTSLDGDQLGVRPNRSHSLEDRAVYGAASGTAKDEGRTAGGAPLVPVLTRF